MQLPLGTLEGTEENFRRSQVANVNHAQVWTFERQQIVPSV
jgi:hypothetical protein